MPAPTTPAELPAIGSSVNVKLATYVVVETDGDFANPDHGTLGLVTLRKPRGLYLYTGWMRTDGTISM